MSFFLYNSQLFHTLRDFFDILEHGDDMFGYVRLHKPSITMGEYEQYKGIYCTLCRRLGKRYGPMARMTLSYDMTFLALLHAALEADDPQFKKGHCSFNPAKRCLNCRNTVATDLAADIGTLLAYYKLKDTLADERFLKKIGTALLYPIYAIDHRRAAKRRPDTDRLIADMMTAQASVETAQTASIDQAAEPFAVLLSTLAADLAQDDRQRTILTRFGYCLGRWIYLIDAVDDLADDVKHHRYNPYALARNIAAVDEHIVTTRQYAVLTLNACLAECIAAYNLLDIRRFDGIIRNILEQGMPAMQQQVVAGEEQTNEP